MADGETGVWCDISTFGVCVSESIAEKMKEQIPGLQCDDDHNTDDDKAPKTDDATQTDDDVKPSDDAVAPDYWTCLEKNGNETACEDAGCTWCDTKGGFGICMDKDAATDANDSDWYTCKIQTSHAATKSGFFDFFWGNNEGKKTAEVSDPTDPSCLLVTLQGDETQCKHSSDADGNPCEWCNVGNYEICLNADQAAFAEQAGGSCNKNIAAEEDGDENIEDPYDPTCIGVTIGGDQSTCTQTLDSDGNACKWCTIGTTDLCVNSEQATFAQQFGGSCSDMVLVDEEELEDPYDPSCLLVNIQGADKGACHAAEDSEGNKCQWCTVGTTSICVDADQAAAAMQLSATCEEAKQDTTVGRSFSFW